MPETENADAGASVRGVRPPAPLMLGSTTSKNWKLFLQKWKIYVTLVQLDKKSIEYQVAMLLHTLGDEALDVYNGFSFTTPDSERTVKQITDAFEQYAVGETNETYERFTFNKRQQSEGESFESFYSSVCGLVKTCNYCNKCIDSIVRDRVVLGVRSNETQSDLLKVRKLTLSGAVDICKAAEHACTHLASISSETVSKVSTHTRKSQHSDSKQGKKKCLFCGNTHEMKKEKCPAYGKNCDKCKGRNHFAAVCKSKSHRNNVHAVDDDEDDWVYTVGNKRVPQKDVKCQMIVANQTVTFQFDTGASVNLLPKSHATHIQPTKRTLRMWNDAVVHPLGTCKEAVLNPKTNRLHDVDFIVCENSCVPLLGCSTSLDLQLVRVIPENCEQISKVSVKDEYVEVFGNGIGTLPGVQHLTVDGSAVPVVMPTRRIPVAISDKLQSEIERLTELSVITPVDEPTPWVSQLVVTMKKSGDIRVCIDPHHLNKVLQREHYTLPILEDSLHTLNESRVFTKADLSSGYWHVVLDEESSLLTTFQTPWGRYRWLRLPFGLSVSSEIFQKRLLEALDGLEGVLCVADDVIIHGKDVEQHDQRYNQMLERCQEKGIKLNADKLQLRTNKVDFMGHTVSENGLQIDPAKVAAITDLEAPTNLEELRRVLGMINYVSRFIPNLTNVIAPLSMLLKKDVDWNWTTSQDTAFLEVKKLLVNTPVLAIYNPNDELILENDASSYGLGSAMWQNSKPVAYASRTLTSSEKNYAQIEKELLAVVYGLEKFHHYTYGRHTQVITDHKPLVAITSKPLYTAPKRLQSLLLRAQVYNYKVSYKPGKDIPVADLLSRAPNDKAVDCDLVHIVSSVPISKTRIDEVRGATLSDESLQELSNVIVTGWPDTKDYLSPSVKLYFSYRDELTVQDGIIYRGERVVIPQSMRRTAKERVHDGHLGINACLRRARDVMYWPGMSADIRQYIETCGVCATYPMKQGDESLQISDLPDRPWQRVASDLLTFNKCEYLVTWITSVDSLNSII